MVSTVAFAVGALGLGTGGYLVLSVRPSASATAKSGAPLWPNDALLSCRGQF